MIQKFFEIFNFRFWLFLFELLYFPFFACVGGYIYTKILEKKGKLK